VVIWLDDSVSTGTVPSTPETKQWAAALEGSRPTGRGKQLTVFLGSLYAAAQRREVAIVLTGVAVLDRSGEEIGPEGVTPSPRYDPS